MRDPPGPGEAPPGSKAGSRAQGVEQGERGEEGGATRRPTLEMSLISAEEEGEAAGNTVV